MQPRTAKISLFILLTSGIIWLGGVNIRSLIGYNLLQPWTSDFKPNIHPYVERIVFSLIAQSSMVLSIAYVVAWVAGIVFLKTTSYRLKDHGWLMMSAIVFYFFTPVEVYTMILDVKMWYLDYIGSEDLVEFRKLFIHRLEALGGAWWIALLCYYTILGLAIFRPFQRKKLPNIMN
ncbi:MAG: hypothetical protein HY707_03110 [Ignavibacteriae bacterium]|nr:hypothetical protein [Ignavibacteriota bacterium]